MLQRAGKKKEAYDLFMNPKLSVKNTRKKVKKVENNCQGIVSYIRDFPIFTQQLNNTTMAKTNEQRIQESLKTKLSENTNMLELLLEVLPEYGKTNPNWGHVGSMGYVNEQLRNIAEHLQIIL